MRHFEKIIEQSVRDWEGCTLRVDLSVPGHQKVLAMQQILDPFMVEELQRGTRIPEPDDYKDEKDYRYALAVWDNQRNKRDGIIQSIAETIAFAIRHEFENENSS